MLRIDPLPLKQAQRVAYYAKGQIIQRHQAVIFILD